MFCVVCINLTVSDVQADESLFDNSLSRVHVVFGYLLILVFKFRLESGIDAALNIDTPAYLINALDSAVPDIAVIGMYTRVCQVSETEDKDKHDEKDRFSNFPH